MALKVSEKSEKPSVMRGLMDAALAGSKLGMQRIF
jgi:hypothetical protein